MESINKITKRIITHIPRQSREQKYYSKSYSVINPSTDYKTLGWQTIKPNKNFTKILKRAIKKVKGKNALDLGCGMGRYSFQLAQLGFNVKAIDFAKPAIKKAKDLSKKFGFNKKIDFYLGNIFALPYKNNYFNIVIDYGCLHHISYKYYNLYLNNVCRVLKKGGYLIIDAHAINSPFYKKYKPLSKKSEFVVEHVLTHFFSKKEFSDIFAKKFILESFNKYTHPVTKSKKKWIVILKKK